MVSLGNRAGALAGDATFILDEPKVADRCESVWLVCRVPMPYVIEQTDRFLPGEAGVSAALACFSTRGRAETIEIS